MFADKSGGGECMSLPHHPHSHANYPFLLLFFFLLLSHFLFSSFDCRSRETTSLPSAEGHQTLFRKDWSAQFGSPQLETRNGSCDPHREPLFYVVLASRNFSSQEVNEMMKYGGER